MLQLSPYLVFQTMASLSVYLKAPVLPFPGRPGPAVLTGAIGEDVSDPADTERLRGLLVGALDVAGLLPVVLRVHLLVHLRRTQTVRGRETV